jgi:ribose-phosphate pyrophosphokinase
MTFDRFNCVFSRTTYPSGESHLRLVGEVPTTILAMTYTFADLCDVVVADRLLRRRGYVVEWAVPYFPFARDDRRNDTQDVSELELALELVRGLNLFIVDPHSDVAGQLPHIAQASVVMELCKRGVLTPEHIICIPDVGAAKKTHTWAARNDVIQCGKRRDVATGKLSGFEILPSPHEIRGRHCIIVDDICDGGGTFLGLAALLRAQQPASLTLAVTHGLFTKGREPLDAAFDRVVSFGPVEGPNVFGYDRLFRYPRV